MRIPLNFLTCIFSSFIPYTQKYLKHLRGLETSGFDVMLFYFAKFISQEELHRRKVLSILLVNA